MLWFGQHSSGLQPQFTWRGDGVRRPPAPEPASMDGKDAFHRVPFILGEVRDAVERTGVQILILQ